MTRRRLGTATTTALLIAVLAALAGCSSDDSLTIEQVTSLGAKRLDDLSAALAEHDEVTVPWHAGSTTSPAVGCADDEERWIGLGTLTVRATSDDGDSPPTRLTAILDNAGWDSGDHPGDLDDDAAIAVPAVPKGDNPAGLRLTVTIERAPEAWHYVVNLTSDCAA